MSRPINNCQSTVGRPVQGSTPPAARFADASTGSFAYLAGLTRARAVFEREPSDVLRCGRQAREAELGTLVAELSENGAMHFRPPLTGNC
uniref:Uncharacterized protein n=1 Tax=Plectus sambesii TaxID=2011161 RepID=A0A914WDA1_9BILA